MKKGKRKRQVAVLLAGGLLLGSMTGGTAGCAGRPNVNQNLPAFSEKGTVYRSAWWCPDPTEMNYDIYKECGLNMVFLANHNFLSVDQFWNQDADTQFSRMKKECYYIGKPQGFEGETMTDKALALAREKGLFVCLSEGGGYFEWIGQDVDVYEDFALDYSGYEDTIVGLFGGDEPNLPAIEGYAAKLPKAEEHFPDIPYFCNLFPMYADATTVLRADNYQSYLDAYCEQVLAKEKGPKMLSVDYYPFQADNFSKWLWNYQMMANKADEYEADFHVFIQACLASDSFEPLREEDVRLQVNVALAYGADAYSYYLYTPPGGEYLSGLVDYEGKPVEMYEFARKANEQTAALEHAYEHYEHVCTIPVSEDPDDFEEGAFAFLYVNPEESLEKSEILKQVEADNRALVSILRDEDGNEAFYLMNFYDKGDVELEEDCEITLTFSGMKKAAVYGTTEKLSGDTVTLDGGKYRRTLKPGEGVLIVPFRK